MQQFAAAACEAIRPLLAGPVVSAQLVGLGTHAAYFRTSSEVFAVLTSSAVALPCTLVLAPGRALPDSLGPGVAVLVGGGRVQWRNPAGDADVAVVATRWWPAPQVLTSMIEIDLTRATAEVMAALGGHALPGGVAQALADAADAVLARAPELAARHLVRVLGVGPGLTPSGDDAAAGLLLTARALAATPAALDQVAQIGQVVADVALERTTAISAALLRHAAAGRAAQVVVDAVAAVAAGSASTAALERLLQLGHTSGADTAAGVLAAVRALNRCQLQTA